LSQELNSVTKKVALIIGAGSALGAEIAQALAARGVRVALNDLLPTRIEQIANEMNGEALAFAGDVSRKLALQTMLQDVLETYERIDILVFIASVRPDDALLDMDEWDWHRTIVGRVMRELGGGIMINVISPESEGSAAYKIAKAGVTALSKAAEAEFAAHNIRVHVAKSAKEVAKLIG
jgi:NAD(P)-dependent dehydrogenase (short-subunit alcohol dehydrogenase family)